MVRVIAACALLTCVFSPASAYAANTPYAQLLLRNGTPYIGHVLVDKQGRQFFLICNTKTPVPVQPQDKFKPTGITCPLVLNSLQSGLQLQLSTPKPKRRKP